MFRDNNHRSREVVRAEISALFHTVVASYGMRVGEMILAVFTVYFSTRLFDPEVYGQMNMISMVAGIIQAFGFGWLGSALIRFGKEEYIQTGGVRQTFRVRFILLSAIWVVSVFIFTLFYFVAQGYLEAWIGLPNPFMWVILLLLILTVLSTELKGYLNVFGKYTQLAGADLSGQIVKLGAVVLLYLHYGVSGIGGLIALTVGGMIAQLLYLSAWLKRDNFYLGRTAGLQDPLRRAVGYSLPALGTSIMGYIYSPIEIFLIRYFVSIKAVGLFSTANSLNRIFASFVTSFPGLTFPILQGLKANGNQEAMRRYYQRVVPQATVLFAPFIGLCLICLPPILKFFLNERYHPAIGAFLILIYGEIPHLPTALQSSYSYIYDKVSQTIWVMSFQYVFELGCYFFLIPRIGIEGAAWGWVAAYLASSVLLTYYVSQEFGACLQSYFAIGLSTLIGIGALLLVGSQIHFELQLLILCGLIIAAGMATKALKLFESRDVELLFSIGMPKFLHRPLRFIYEVLG